MNQLLKKIYENVLVYEESTQKITKEVDETIKAIMESYQNQLAYEEQEKLQDLLSSVALTATQAGIELGIQFLFQLLSQSKYIE